MSKPIAIGSDEAGFELKTMVLDLLHEKGLVATDFGCFSPDPVDYPDVA